MSKASRKYEAGVERALGLFDTSNEWADYIAFLSRLYRALQGGPEGTDIPFKQMVAKNLAQCLTPALPSGVHQKALEVYTSIFSIIGRERLAKDLALYLPGVSHTLSFGSLSVRPLFLLLIREHVLRLPVSALRPALKAILLSLLPGLEDDSTEDFETTLATVSDARIMFAREGFEGFFWQSLFLVTITSPNRRPGAFVYLARHLPKLRYPGGYSSSHVIGDGSHEDPLDLILRPEPGLLIRCFAAGLLDEQVLVQRNFLDLLVTHLPIGALAESKRVVAKDIEILVSAAVSVILRRDMSLNKRLWSWFFGAESQDQMENDNEPVSPGEARSSKQSLSESSIMNQNESYFKQYSLSPITQSLYRMIEQESSIPPIRARPYRIALSLMDRWEVGGPVVAATFVPLIRSLQSYHGVAASEEAYAEVFRSANVFFDGVESNLIWSQLFGLYQQEEWDLINFVVSRFNLEEEEMLVLHLPLFAILLYSEIAVDDNADITELKRRQIQTILAAISNLVPERAYEGGGIDPPEACRFEVAKITSIQAFYNTNGQSGLAPDPPFSRAELTRLSLHTAANTYLSCLTSRSTILHEFTQTFVILITKAPSVKILDDMGLLGKVEEHLTEARKNGIRWHQLLNTSIASVLVSMCGQDNIQILKVENVQRLIRHLVRNFWGFLSPSTPQFHVESIQHVVGLHTASKIHRTVESTIVSLVTDTQTMAEQRIDRFSVLWNHIGKEYLSSFLRQPLLSVLDMAILLDVFEPARQWIKNLPFNSLDFVYGAIFENSRQDYLTRSLGVLSMQTEEQWRALNTEAGLTTREKLSSVLLQSLDIAKNDIKSSGLESKEVLEVLSLLRVLQSHGAFLIEQTAVTSVLVSLLQQSTEGSLLQHDLLETLQELTLGRESLYPPEILAVLLEGISTTVDESVDRWMSLTCAVIMLYDEKIFQVLLKVTDCFCSRLDSCLQSMQDLFDSTEQMTLSSPEKLTVNLLGGLEYILARAHQRLGERERQKTPKSPDQPQGLFGAVVSSNNYAMTEEKLLRSSFANDRLTVILCFQDAIKLCYRYWSWGAASHVLAAGTQASLYHVASKIRSRSRRILDNLLDAEPQECLETLIALWADATRKSSQVDGKRVLNLLQSLRGGRPRLTLPITFNAIYNRTNPAALDKDQRSTMSTGLSAMELATFLTEYTVSLEDDLVEEIWVDCTTFLREVLGNPMPHRQILLHLLEFIAVLCSKMENTNFGEENKMRKELGDICLRLFTAIFTVKPGGLDAAQIVDGSSSPSPVSIFDARNLLQVLCSTLPSVSHVLTESDRFTTVLTGVATHITAPMLKSKNFPQNISLDVLILLQILSKPSSSSRSWRKDVLDAFSDARFFSSSVQLIRPGWLPLIHQLLLSDKTLLLNNLGLLAAPTTAGLVFGVGAAAARTEADKRTQAVLRRLALIFVAHENDAFAGTIGQIHTKVEQLLLATKESSPSFVIRAEVYMLLRALILTTSPIHLSLLWPTIDSELRDAFSSYTNKDTFSKYATPARLQAAKLLDLLLLLRPDEFQLHEWLFVTDTVDAIYPPADFDPSSLSDLIARTISGEVEYPLPTSFARKLRKPWLCSDMSREVPAEDVDTMLLMPFFQQLSIHAFEDIYSLGAVDKDVCVDDLIADLFNS